MFNKNQFTKIINKNKLSDGTWNGTVVDGNDPDQVGRIRVSIPNLTAGLPKNVLPWYTGKQNFGCSPNSQGHIPPVGSEVVVEFPTDDIYNGVYSWVMISKVPEIVG